MYFNVDMYVCVSGYVCIMCKYICMWACGSSLISHTII
jgi:hypothetical protein